MTFKLKTYTSLLLFTLLTIFTSCLGQNTQKDIGANQTKSQHKATPIGKSVSKMENGLSVIFQDGQNNYWFGGGKNGVYKYVPPNRPADPSTEAADPSTNQVKEKSLVLFTMQDGLCSNSILGIQEDKFGNIYFDTSKGVSKYDGQKFTTLKVIENKSLAHEWKLEPDDLWFRMGTDKNGPYRYKLPDRPEDAGSLHHIEFPKPNRADEFYAEYPNASYNPYGIYTMYKDSKGSLWFGTASLGVCRFDQPNGQAGGKSISWLYEKQLTETPSGGDFGIRSILEDKGGFFWFCNTRYRYKISVETIERNGTSHINYTKENGIGYSNEKGGIEFPYFLSIAEDNDGDLWMVTYNNGVWRNDGKKLIHYPIIDGKKEVLLFSIYQDNQGDLWLGTHNAGVYKYNGSKFEEFKP